MKLTFEALLIFSCVVVITGWDLTLDTQKDSRAWRIKGNYFYAQSIVDGGRLAPQLESEEPGTTKGVWYFKYAPVTYDNDNYFEIYFSLSHQLIYQSHVRLLAHPSVAVMVKNGEDKVVGTFYSTGKKWCDAVRTERLNTQIKVAVNLTQPESYVMIDKITVGIATNITKLNMSDINPCFTTRQNSSENILEMDGVQQDLFHTTVNPLDMSTLLTTQLPPSNQINKIGISESSESQEITQSSNVTASDHSQHHSILSTKTMTENGANVNCQCSCNCTKTDD